MQIIPAIDLKDGQCVRLTQGQFDQVTVYGDNPDTVAKQWETEGAAVIHVVDLDGAKEGVIKNKESIARIVSSVRIPVEVGGGIRSEQTAAELFSLGVARIILGTVALEDPSLLQSLLEQYGEKVVVALDAKNGQLVSHGWLQDTNHEAVAMAKGLEKMGVSRVQYTDVLKDGMLSTPNLPFIRELLESIHIPVIIGGGISTIQDIRSLASLKTEGVVIGKALYEGKLTVKEAVTCLQND